MLPTPTQGPPTLPPPPYSHFTHLSSPLNTMYPNLPVKIQAHRAVIRETALTPSHPENARQHTTSFPPLPTYETRVQRPTKQVWHETSNSNNILTINYHTNKHIETSSPFRDEAPSGSTSASPKSTELDAQTNCYNFLRESNKHTDKVSKVSTREGS